MSVQQSHLAVASEPLTLDAAHEHLQSTALRPGPVSAVGLELESHLVDLRAPARRVGWERLNATLDGLRPLPGRSRVTVEPGGQVELSGPPEQGIAAAVDSLRRDQRELRTALATDGMGTAGIGTDPVRPAARINPGPRYAAMEQHFTATGQRAAGAAMMCSTAALQINLDAGPAPGWPARVRLAHQLGPVLVALSACSPLLAGRVTGWRSSRQRIWTALDQARCGPVPLTGNPARDWATFALRAPVMLVRDQRTGAAEAVRSAIPFESWVAEPGRIGGRLPTVEDLDYHLTTLFPPVRLRGFLEIRCIDAVPARWWPALAAITAALLDDPAAADEAADASEPVATRWVAAARDGLGDRELRRAAIRCVGAAAAAVPPGLSAQVQAYAERIEAGRDLGSEMTERARRDGTAGALALLEEEAHA
jgi:glutamate--cysteine ligase